jgi:hypothetical protein
MSKHNNREDRHPLSERHFRQIICRPGNLRKRMQNVWGLTWRPGGRSGSFNGKLFRKLGTAIAQVQVSYPLADNREGIALFGVLAGINPQTAVVSYDEAKLTHEFHRVPFVGARGSILDPSDDSKGGRGNGSWVQLGLEVDRLRQRAVERHFQLNSVPELPRIFLAYGDREKAHFTVTDALIERAAGDIEVNFHGHGDMRGFSSELVRLRRAAFDDLPADEQQTKLRAAWESVFISPKDQENDTGLWLMPHEFGTDVYSTVGVFECFSGMVGADVFNPARKLGGKAVDNPAREVAKAAGLDLDVILEGSDDQPLRELLPAYRQALGIDPAATDENLLLAMCSPDEQVMVESAVQDLPEAAQIKLMRAELKPHISECCTDNDILNAVIAPANPLYASGLCRVQVLYRNPRMPVEEALRFPADVLGRERMQATLWHPMPQPKPRADRKAKPQKVEHVPVPEPVAETVGAS